MGSPVTATQLMVFSIYNQESGGSPLWAETHTSVDVINGSFYVVLGSVTPIPSSIATSVTLWLEISVEGESLTPRSQLNTVPYGFKAEESDHAIESDHASTAELATHATYADTATWTLGVGGITHADLLIMPSKQARHPLPLRQITQCILILLPGR